MQHFYAIKLADSVQPELSGAGCGTGLHHFRLPRFRTVAACVLGRNFDGPDELWRPGSAGSSAHTDVLKRSPEGFGVVLRVAFRTGGLHGFHRMLE